MGTTLEGKWVSKGDCFKNMVMDVSVIMHVSTFGSADIMEYRMPVYYINETEKAVLWCGPGGHSFWLPKKSHIMVTPYTFRRARFPEIVEKDNKGNDSAQWKYFVTGDFPGARRIVTGMEDV